MLILDKDYEINQVICKGKIRKRKMWKQNAR
jgi:hypothetical protein